ncbi:MAG: hypothetical protein WD068_00450, partial [Candidatus Babeliales bacterium]
KPLLGLVMIVKDEAHWVAKGLATIAPFIDYWCILDTGSTDGTQDLIKEALKDVPGQLYQEPFIDFGASRNRVLALAGENAVFVVTLNADDFVCNGAQLRAFCEHHRDHHAATYMVLRTDATQACDYYCRRLIRTSAHKRFVGKTHEYLDDFSEHIVPDVAIFFDPPTFDGERKKRAWERDLKILSDDYDNDPTNTRTVFYLAQTYECLGILPEAFKFYAIRAAMGGWREEHFEALYRKARVSYYLKKPFTQTLEYYLDAYNFSQHRAEPLYELANIYLERKNYSLAYMYGVHAARIPFPPQDWLFVQRNVYTYKMYDLLGIVSWYIGEYEMGERALKKALEQYPNDQHLLSNLQFYSDRKKNMVQDKQPS